MVSNKMVFQTISSWFCEDISLNYNGRIAIGLGIGYAYNRLISNLNWFPDDDQLIFYYQR